MISTSKNNIISAAEKLGLSLEDVMQSIVKQDGDIWTTDEQHPNSPLNIYHTLGRGAGTELKKILETFGIKSTATCSCNQRAKTMNENGIEWCKNNKDTILSWLQEESLKRNLPFFKFAGKRIINLAIQRAEKKNQ